MKIARWIIGIIAGLGGRLLRAIPALEWPIFSALNVSTSRPFRSFRFRLFKAWAAGLPEDRAVRPVALDGTLKLVVDLRDWCGITYIAPHAIEPVTTAYLRNFLRPGDVFADIGANVGYMTLIAAERVGAAGQILCFEPNPRLVPLILDSVRRSKIDDRVKVFPIALANADEVDRPFFLSENVQNSGLSSLVPSADHIITGQMREAAVRVQAVKFDTFVIQNRIDRLDGLKIDVEGAEELVLQGMRESITRLQPRFIICETGLDSPGFSVLRQLGYEGRMLEEMQPKVGWGNVLFEPKRAKQ